MISAYRTRNLRAIVDSGWIKFAKINVLVGKNSAGKSTLLRVLPLLRQSVERPTKGPILWYGRFVDFGNFQNAVNSESKADGVVFEFVMNLRGASKETREVDRDELLLGSAENAHFYKDLSRVQASLTVGIDLLDEVGAARSITLDLGSDTVHVSFNQASAGISVEVNGRQVSLSSRRKWLSQPGKILPTPLVVKEESYSDAGISRTYLTIDIRPFSEQLIDSLIPFFHGNTSREKVAEFASTLLYSEADDFFEQLRSQSSISNTFYYQLQQCSAKSNQISRIREAVLLASISGIFRRVDQELADFASGVRYVEPLRATAQRYYRQQDLAVDEIDSRGENAAMFLSSLQPWERTHLKTWMLKNLGFHADVEQGSGHIQVKISSDVGVGKNIADLGFGFSQMLPIILLVWRSLVSPGYVHGRKQVRPILAIEQPELHLHPNFQAQIADVMAAVLTEKKGLPACVFLETHSEHIVNRLGQLIGRGRLKKNDVQVLVVEEDASGASVVRRVGFDEKGFMDDNWPSGFFVPEIS